MTSGEVACTAPKKLAYVQLTMQTQGADRLERRAAVGADVTSGSIVHQIVLNKPGGEPRRIVAQAAAEHVTLLF